MCNYISMKKILLFLFIFFAFNSFSQNYDLVIPDKVNYFWDNSNFLHALLVDSFEEINGDTIYYGFSRPRGINSFSYSMLGKAMVKRSNDWLILNMNGDSIFIENKALLNNSWTAFEIDANTIIQGSVNSITYKEIYPTVFDTVLKINFTMMDINGIFISDEINATYLELSKHHGLISTIDFALFPNIEFNNSNVKEMFMNETPYHIMHLKEIRAKGDPLEELKKKYYFNYEVGDVFQSFLGSSDGDYLTNEVKEKEVLSNGDIKYLIERTHKQQIDEFEYSTTVSEQDLLIESDAIIQKFENKIYPYIFYNSTNGTEMVFSFQDKEVDLLIYTSYFTSEIRSNGTCCKSYNGGGSVSKFNYYYEGIGGRFYSSITNLSNGQVNQEYKLIYYKKGNKEWGELFTSIPEIETDSKNINIYPNPNSGKFHFEIENNSLEYTIRVKNILGEKFLEIATQKNFLNLDLSLAKGLYIIEIVQESKKFTKKFVIN